MNTTFNMIYITGPGHGGPGLVANTTRRDLQRGLSEHLSGRSGHEAAVQAVLVSRRHSEPCRAGNARLIHEGGELGYAVSHAFGAAFDNPDLIVACVVGEGEPA